jgi:hypothetical protein
VRTRRRAALRLPRRGHLLVRLENRNRFRVHATLLLRTSGRLTREKRIRFATATVTIAPRSSKLVRLKISPANRRKLARYPGLRSSLFAIVRNDAREQRRAEWTFTLRAR